MSVDRVADYALRIAFNETVAGVFYIETSALDGTDGLTDLGLFSGTFDTVTDDVVDAVTVAQGTDNVAGAVLAGSLSADLSRPDNLSYWNPNNPASPLNTVAPGFVPMRPVKLEATQDGVTYGIFYGFIRRATWDSDSCACHLECEDLLLWASRCYPVIASTGPTTTGAAIGLILDAIGWRDAALRSLDAGDNIADFSADGTATALDLIATLLTAERGTVYVRGDGVVVYERRDKVRTRASSWTLDDELNTQSSAIDLDSIFTRAAVTRTGGVTATSIDAAAERVYGRSEHAAIDSPYLPSDLAAAALASDLVYEGAMGKPPINVDVDNDSADTLNKILTSPLLSVFTISETLGNTAGDYIVESTRHTIKSQYHSVQYLLTKRQSREFTVDGSDLAGTDPLRY